MMLYQAIEAQLNKSQGCLITKDQSYSYPEIAQEVEHFSALLISHGVQHQDALAVQLEKSEYTLFLYLACLRLGIIYLPLNTGYTTDELHYFFDDAKHAMIICEPDKEAMMPTKVAIKTLDQHGHGSFTALTPNKHFSILKPDDFDIAVILYTSGTTGKPKGAMITQSALLSNALDLIDAWGITKQDSLLHMLPLYHVHGLFFALHTALLSGANIIFLPKFDAADFFEHASQSTIFMGVPTYYTRLLQDPRLSKETCASMRLFISGSAPLLPKTFDDFKTKTGHIILERYGMTETGINTSNPLHGKRKVGSVGLPLKSVRVRLDSTPIGEIQIKGDNLFKGYWKKEEETKKFFTVDGWFKTGDLGSFDTEGYLSIVGRSKDMIITGGLNVYPKEIECVLDNIEGVVESAVIGIPDSDFGETVIAIVVRSNAINKNQISDILKQKLAGYKRPKQIFFVDALPKNTMGKVQKNVLRERYLKMGDRSMPTQHK